MSKSHDFSRRALNLSLAIYRVTARFAQGEVLAGQMRESGNQIAGDLAEGNFAAAEKKIERLKIYFAIAKEQNWVKPINWSVLDFEYYKLQQEVIFELKSRGLPMMGKAADLRGENEGNEEGIVSHNIRRVKKTSPKEISTATENSNLRQTKILAALDGNSSLKMSDLAPLFKDDVSERTLRNELANMIKSGLLKKSGVNKFTEYSRA